MIQEGQNDWNKEDEDEDDEMSMMSDLSESGIQMVLQKQTTFKSKEAIEI